MALGFQIGAPCNVFQRQCGGQGAAPPAGVFLKDARQRKAVGEKHLQPPVNQQDAAAAAEGVLKTAAPSMLLVIHLACSV